MPFLGILRLAPATELQRWTTRVGTQDAKRAALRGQMFATPEAYTRNSLRLVPPPCYLI
jgi:hypothetical protein